MKKHRNKVQFIAMIMSVVLMIGLPLPAFAQAAVDAAVEQAQNQPVLITDKLTENETYWQNADGSITYQSHLEPIRYQDEQGNWHDIENDVVQVDKSVESEDPFKEESYDYRSESSKSWVLLDEDIRSQAPIKIQQGEYSITAKPLWNSQSVIEAQQSIDTILSGEQPETEIAEPTQQEQETPENLPAVDSEDQTDLQMATEEPLPQATQQDMPMQPVDIPVEEALPESRLSFQLKKEQEQLPGIDQQPVQRVQSNQPVEEYDPYTYSSELEYQSVEYSNVFEEGVGLRIQPNNTGVKEDIILTELPENTMFTFELNVEGVVLELVPEDGIVMIKDQQSLEVLGFIPQPFMVDSGTQEEYENISFDIGVELQDLGQGKYLYTLMPSDEYLQDENTVYPVKIDPSINIDGAKKTKDTYVDSSHPNSNYYTNQYLRVGHDTAGAKFRSIMSFDLPSGLDKAYISEATVNTYQSYNGSSTPMFGMYRVKIPWESSNLTWNNVTAYLELDGKYAEGRVGGVGWYTWPATNLARAWSTKGNFGLLFKSEEESAQRYKRWYSSDSSVCKPILTLVYTPIDTATTVRVYPEGNNSSKGDIKVNWNPQAGIKIRAYLDGKAVDGSGDSYTWHDVVAGVDHKVKVEFYTDYGVRVFSEEKTARIPDNSPPVFSDVADAYIEDGNAVLSFEPAFKPSSIKNVSFPIWTENKGQDDLKWHAKQVVGTTTGTWSTTVNISEHNNETGVYFCHVYGTTDEDKTENFGDMPFNFGTQSRAKGNYWGTLEDGPVAGEILYEKISSTQFRITASRVTRKDAIAKHEIYWSQVGSEEKHLLETLNGYLGSEVERSYDPEQYGLPSGESIYFSIKAFDTNGNYTTMELPSNPVDIPNYIRPQQPSVLRVVNEEGAGYTYDQQPSFAIKDSVKLEWQVEKGVGSEYDIAHIQYKIDQGEWITMDPEAMTDPESPITQNGYMVPTDTLSEGTHSISVRAVDNNSANQLSGTERTIQIQCDRTTPVMEITYPEGTGEIPTWQCEDTITITQVIDEHFQQVEAYIGVQLPWSFGGLDAAYQQVPITFSTNEQGEDTWPATISLAGQQPNQTYNLRIIATDSAGNHTIEQKTFNLIVPEEVEVYDHQLTLQYGQSEQGAYLINERIHPFIFSAAEGVTIPEGATASLFMDGYTVTTSDVQMVQGQVTFTVDVLSEQNRPLFLEGEEQTLSAVVYDAQGNAILSSQSVYVQTMDDAWVQEDFAALDGFALQQDGQLVANQPTQGQSFTLQGVQNGYGILQSVSIAPVEGLPSNVKFEVSFFDGTQYVDPVVIQAGQTATFDYQSAENHTVPYGYQIKGFIESTDGLSAPLTIPQLTITASYAGVENRTLTNLAAKPEALSAQPLVNYTTWLRWDEMAANEVLSNEEQGDQQQPPVTYDVYRKAQGSQQEECIAQGLTEPYYYDYNLMYGQTFEYWVVKHVPYTIDGTDVQYAHSKPSDAVTATMVDENEIQKYLGLQNYWNYLAAEMGNGTGYINTASGNLVYQKSDFTQVGPLLASVMRRTFNSQATSESALGKGWDFSFNTNLLVEYGLDDTGARVETALLLKDGDGTVHRYEKQTDGSYKAPDGVFITLEAQQDGTFKATRSDDIVYTFNQSMFIQSFAEPNGNQLLFEYDEKGRMTKVIHSLYQQEGMAEENKQYITFEYGTGTHNQDKIVKANNVFGNENGQLVQQSYLYTYYDDPSQANYGMLKRIETTVQRPFKILNETQDSQGNEQESVTDSQETITMYESYEYGTEDGNQLKIVSPANSPTTAGETKHSTLTLDQDDRVTLFTNANEDTSAMAYAMLDENHQQTTVTNTADGSNVGSVSYTTDLSNHGVVTQTTAVNGRKTYYENYTDTLKAQTIRTYRDAEESQPVVYAMTYDSLGNVLTVLAPDGVLTTNTYAEGKDWLTSQTLSKEGTILNKATYTYDNNGNQLTATTAVSDPASFTDTKTTTFTYNNLGLMTSQTAWNGQQTTYAYDSFGRLSESTVSGSGIGQTTRYTYDIYGNPSTTTSERGSQDITVETQYDALGYLLQTTDPTGMVQSYRYNANGLQTEQLTMGYTESGNFVEAKKTTVQYDEINRAATTTNPNGTVQAQDVSAGDGLITINVEMAGEDGTLRQSTTQSAVDGSYTVKTNHGLGSKTYYDYIGNMNRVTQLHNGTEERGVNAAYNVMGQVIHTWDDTNTVESYTDYDDLGNVLREWTYVKTEGDVRKYTVKQYTHNLEGQVTSVREYTNLLPYGTIVETEPYQTTSYTYDESAGDGLTKNTVTDAEGGVTETYYNQMGQVVKEVQKGRNSTQHIVTIYQYDAYGRQTEVKQGDQTTQTTKQTYEYDAYDRVKTQRTNNSTYTELEYDHFGRRDEMIDHTDGETIRSSWAYDKNDQALFVLQDGKIMGFTYNGVGDMTSIRYSAGNILDIEGAVRTVSYDYDELGRLTAVNSGVVDTSNETWEQNVKTVKEYAYAANGDLTTSNEYLEFDTKADKQGIKLTQSYTYDALGRPTEITYKQGEAVKEKYTQSYDGRNYITAGSYTDGYGDTAKTLNRTYQYDAIGRLTQNSVSNSEKTKTTSYQYDKVGNRLYQTVNDGTKTVSTKYTYNALGQLTQTQKGLGAAGSVASWLNEEVYTYDVYGNQTGVEVYEINEEVTSSEKSGDVRYTYDESNQMVKYETKGVQESEWTEAARNVYNGEGMRIRQYENGNDWARQYFYIGGALTISTDGSNENFVKSENIIDPSGTIIAARREAKDGEQIEGSAYWIYHYDAQGSATNLVGVKNGALYRAEENIYDAFGNEETDMKETVSSVQNDIKFTGATLDNSGTYYLGSRHYDPNTGRFLQQDTFKGDVYSPWTQNLYTYTSNNPVNYVDPTGHWIEELIEKLLEAARQEVQRRIDEVKAAFNTATSLEQPQDQTGDSVVDSNVRTASNRGTAYATRQEAVYQMEETLKNLSDESNRQAEYWAFVYEYEGQFYISNARTGFADQIYVDFVKDELNSLGLLVDGQATVSIDFAHTHMAMDERRNATDYVVGRTGKKDINGQEIPLTVGKDELVDYPVHTRYGSLNDYDVINRRTYDQAGTIPLNSFSIIAPTDTGGWREPERKIFGEW